MNNLAPEEIELNKKRAVLDRLKDRLATSEEEMTDLRSRLDQFEAQYTMEVGRLYAELDEIEAQIAEEEVKLVPDDVEIRKKAEEMRRRAAESAQRARKAASADLIRTKPTSQAKKAYHNLARIIHPDLALDDREKEKRHSLMARLNAAYSTGNQKTLNKMVEDFRDSPDLISGDSIGDNLVRAIRQISQVKRRLIELRDELTAVRLTELFVLREKMQAEMAEGRNMLRHISERTKTHIKKSERRLANLRNVNKAAEEYVKERFGMDISDFR